MRTALSAHRGLVSLLLGCEMALFAYGGCVSLLPGCEMALSAYDFSFLGKAGGGSLRGEYCRPRRGLEREGPTNEAIVGKNVVLGGLRPTEGIAAGRRKGNHPLLPWGRRGIVELLRSSEATTLPGETRLRPKRKVEIGR